MNSLFEERLRGIQPIPLFDRYFSGPDFPDAMPPERIAAFQLDSLQAIIQNAYDNCAFYQKKMAAAKVTPQDIQTLEDIAKLPMTAKDELRQDPYALLACPKEAISIVHVSTGTTGGQPIYIMYTWEDYFRREAVTGYPKLFPVETGDICLNALPYEMSSAGLAFHKTFMNSCEATVIPCGKGGAYSTPEKTIQMIRDLQPTVVMTTPSYSITLAEAAEAASFDLKSLSLKKLWLTGEGCSPAFRDRVEKIWGTKANFYYGSLEAGVIAIECDAHAGYHTTDCHVLVEIIDPKTGEKLDPGQIGEIVVTCLLRYDTPLIRYRTQDLGYIDPDTCRCQVGLPRLFLRGRLVDHITIQGVQFSPFYLEEFLMRLPEVGFWYQFIVKPGDNDALKIRCELTPGQRPSQQLAETLGSKMEFAIGIPCEFEFVEKLPRPRAKTVRVVYS